MPSVLDEKLLAFDKLALDKLALDRASARHIDAQGFMHVDGCNISKSAVNPYFGHEIPNWRAHGLVADRVYHVLRPAEELAKAAPTFNSLPLLDAHRPVGAMDLEDPALKNYIVGATGTDAVFEAPYLKNSIVLWTADAINGVNDKTRYELSCGYRYTFVPTPGVYEGVAYDGVMSDIVGNHVALVETGRAGHDVVVADAAHDGGKSMKQKARALTPVGQMVRGALYTYLSGHMAADAKIVPGEISKLVKNIAPARYGRQVDGLVGAVSETFKDRLAGTFACDDLNALLSSMEGELTYDASLMDELDKLDELEEQAELDKLLNPDNPDTSTQGGRPSASDESLVSELMNKISSYKIPEDGIIEINRLVTALINRNTVTGDAMPTPEDLKAEAEKLVADAKLSADKIVADAKLSADKIVSDAQLAAEKLVADATKISEEAKKDPGVTQSAMDAALAEIKKATTAELAARFQAAKDVQPIIGDVDALAADSAEAIYKLALDSKKVDTSGVHPSAYRALLKALPAVAEPSHAADSLTVDAASVADFATRYPHAATMVKG